MLTPEEIQSREFLVSLRGYDRDEVHAFLDEVADSFSQLLADGGGTDVAEPVEEAAAEQAVVEPEPVVAETPVVEASPFAAIGAETQRILDAAQEAGEEIRRKAQSEADAARDEALAVAQKEVAFLREQASATQDQIDALVARRDELSQRLHQARETVDVALLELEDNDAEVDSADATNSVLAEAGDQEELELDDKPAAKKK